MYDITQTSFLFSVYANAASSIEGTAPQLAGLLDLALDQGGTWSNGTQKYAVRGLLNEIGSELYGSAWEVTWGPAIYQPANTQYAANAMAVLYSASQDLYVVAIAGTNMDDVYDWLKEDFAVGPNAMVDFPISLVAPPVGGAASAASTQVSLGTARGIYNLLENMIDRHGEKLSLLDYLRGLTPSSDAGGTILFVGHSLGGALSAALPLQVLASIDDWGWTRDGLGKVCAMPTAAPAPGNEAFSTLWGNSLTPVSVSDTAPENLVTALNVPLADRLDLVPHAWTNIYASSQDAADPCYFFDWAPTKLTLQTIPAPLYGLYTEVMAPVAIRDQQNGSAALMATLPNVQWQQPSFPITYWDAELAEFATYTLPPAPVKTEDAFEEMVVMIHVWQYFQFFGITTAALPYPVTSLQSSKAVAGISTITGQPA